MSQTLGYLHPGALQIGSVKFIHPCRSLTILAKSFCAEAIFNHGQKKEVCTFSCKPIA